MVWYYHVIIIIINRTLVSPVSLKIIKFLRFNCFNIKYLGGGGGGGGGGDYNVLKGKYLEYLVKLSTT